MREREIDLDSNICHYKHNHESSQTIYYVKGCGKGKICKQDPTNPSNYVIKTCQKTDKLKLSSVDEPCENDSQCDVSGADDGNLVCKNSKCTFKEAGENTNKYFPYTKGGIKYCPSDHIYISGGFCELKSSHSDYSADKCYNDGSNSYEPEFLKVCGEIEFKKVTTTDPKYEYIKKTVSTASIGSLPDGTYVDNPLACESGFVLKYYPNNQIDKVDPNDESTQYKRCATIDEIDIKRGIIKYNLDGADHTIRYSSVQANSDLKIERIKIMLDMFKKYKKKMDKCEVEKYDSHPFTCGGKDRNLNKYYLFYLYPYYYNLYKDEDQVIDYLIEFYNFNFQQYNSLSYLLLLFLLLLI